MSYLQILGEYDQYLLNHSLFPELLNKKIREYRKIITGNEKAANKDYELIEYYKDLLGRALELEKRSQKMRACEIIEKIEEFAPQRLACSWDNPGFLCGNPDKEVNKVLLTLDVDLFSVNEAIEKGADMIISHHPLFFTGLKKIDFSTPEGKIVELLIKNDIVVFAAHTNMDAAEKGINQRLAKMFDLQEIKNIGAYGRDLRYWKIRGFKGKDEHRGFCRPC